MRTIESYHEIKVGDTLLYTTFDGFEWYYIVLEILYPESTNQEISVQLLWTTRHDVEVNYDQSFINWYIPCQCWRVL